MADVSVTEYRLVRIEPYTAADLERAYPDAQARWRLEKRLKRRSFTPPAPLGRVPPPPDYSTPAAVTKRIVEGGPCGRGDKEHPSFTLPPAPSAEYEALRRAMPPLPCRAEDLHVSRWRIVPVDTEYCRNHRGSPRPASDCGCERRLLMFTHTVRTWTLTDAPAPTAPAA